METRGEFHRKVAVGMFSKKLLDYGTDLALKEAKKLMAKLDDAARTGATVDLQKCFYAFTMDVFAQIAFGVEFNSQEKNIHSPSRSTRASEFARTGSQNRLEA